MSKTHYSKAFTQYIVLILFVIVLLSPLLISSASGAIFGSHAREATPVPGEASTTSPEGGGGAIPAGPCGDAIAQAAQARVGEQAVDYFPQDPTHACAHFVAQVVNPIAQPPPYLGDSAQGQWDSTAGKQLSQSELAPGDVVYFGGTYDNGRAVSHTGIYIGSGSFIDSGGAAGPDGTQTVKQDSLSGYWQNHYYGAKRYCLGEEASE